MMLTGGTFRMQKKLNLKSILKNFENLESTVQKPNYRQPVRMGSNRVRDLCLGPLANYWNL